MKTILDYFNNPKSDQAIWRFPEEDLELTFEQLSEHSLAFSYFLKERGVLEGDLVGMILDNSSDYVISLMAVWRLGAVAVPIRPKAGRNFDYGGFIDYVGSVCDFRLLLTHGELDLKIDKPVHVIQDIYKFVTPDAWRCDARVSPEDTAIIQFSSGSTGNPKGAIITHAMIIAQLSYLKAVYSKKTDGLCLESNACWLPINHDLGIFTGILVPIFNGANNLLASPRYYMENPLRWFQHLSQYKVDSNFTTSSVLASSLKVLKFLSSLPEIDLSHLQLCIGAEKVSANVLDGCCTILKPFNFKPENMHPGYGMSENTLCATFPYKGVTTVLDVVISSNGEVTLANSTDKGVERIVSIGVEEPGQKVTIRDKNDKALPDLHLGELCVTGPCVTPGYLNNKEKTASAIIDGRLHTGDLGFSYQGEFYYYTRKDDLLIVGGRNIVPDDVELVVEGFSYVRPACAALLGFDNEIDGTIELNLLIELDIRKLKISHAEVKKEIHGKVFKHFDLILNKITIVQKGTIEKTSSGKKRRKVIKQRLLSGEVKVEQEISDATV